ncbi:hypothetical protein T440DRAFT_498265 [Plenodomus tracheiphilus IPT5]|uniref:Uncharacterized protein n=1 Tax=Plenodomus tracheiphilus IPT5 TaxID=1408161 RepID=A0A6A7B8F2_9PLEO|nr:hypothetical protein T440DRAFT_498265 [Plenodomus tracheiphilus IPT5]
MFSRYPGFAQLPKQRQLVIVNRLWPHLGLQENTYVPKEYVDLLNYFSRVFAALHQHGQNFVFQDLEGPLDLVDDLKKHRALTKEMLVWEVGKAHLARSIKDIARSIELAARLWTGISISSKTLEVVPNWSRDSHIGWPTQMTLAKAIEETIAGRFSSKASSATIAEFAVDESFTAVKLKKICRFHIQWTDNLTDHLRTKGDRGKRILSIYRHKILLVNHLKDPVSTAINSTVLDEAIRTLDLLFPFGDSKTADFLEAEGVNFYSVSFGNSRPDDLSAFVHWRYNLAFLMQILHGPPETVTQTLTDTRNLSQFATLWVAIFGVFALTIVFGILTTVYSIKSYRVAFDSYDLALAAACEEFPLLPHCQRL